MRLEGSDSKQPGELKRVRANFALTGVRSVPFPCFLLSRPLLSLVVSASLSYRGFEFLSGSL